MSFDFKKFVFLVMLATSAPFSIAAVAEEPGANPLPAPEQARKGEPVEEKTKPEKKIEYDIAADELTLEDKKGNGLYVTCSFSSHSQFRGGFINGNYQSSGWGTLADKLSGACQGCLESRSGHCRFVGCTAKEYYTNARGERVYPDRAALYNVFLDKTIDTSCEPGKRVVRTVEESSVALVPIEPIVKNDARPEKNSGRREEARQDRSGFTHSYGYSQSWESDSSGFVRGSRSAYDSDRNYQLHEEYFRPPTYPFGRGPRVFPPGSRGGSRENARPEAPSKSDGRAERSEEGIPRSR